MFLLGNFMNMSPLIFLLLVFMQFMTLHQCQLLFCIIVFTFQVKNVLSVYDL